MTNSIKFIGLLCLLAIFSIKSLGQADITAKELEFHVKFLASDSLKGRKPGTLESSMAAQYIADQFSHFGLKLLGNKGFQYFDVISGVKAGKNTCKIGKSKLIFEKDFTALSYSENRKLKSKIVFAGYGFDIKTDKLVWNDYENIDVKGKWVLILRGTPEMDKAMSQFSAYESERSKILTARDKGAGGVLFVTPSGMDKEDVLIPLKMGRGEVKSGLPVVHLKREVVNNMLSMNKKAVDDLEKLLKETQKPASFETGISADITTQVDYVAMKTQNVVAILEGNDPVLKNEHIILGAHFDHLGFGGPGSGSRRPDTVAVHNGADDNASGVATILEIAQFLASKKQDLKRSVIFIAFGAEEIGLLGSQFYVNNPLIDLKLARAMFNFDMVGRLDKTTKAVSVGGTGTSKEWEDILNKYQKESSLKLSYSKEGFGPSDHASFYGSNIPVIYFNTGIHGDYHTPADDAELLNYEGQAELSSFVSQIAFQLASMTDQLTFQEAGPKKQSSGMGELKVRLGIMPGFASSDNNGLKVEGVTKDGPASKAGIEKGDLITAMNGEKITNIYDYMERMKKFKPGERISIDIKRGDEKKVVIVDL